jgi:hypothetical protein
VALTWSKKTGKIEIEMDGSDNVWFGRRSGASVFDYKWTTKEECPLTLRILATNAPKLHENFRCYDLIINDKVFAHLPLYGDGSSSIALPESDLGEFDQRPSSILDVIYPNGYTPPPEQRQPDHQVQQPSTPPVVDMMSQVRAEPEPIVDLLG